ncbi:MAG TPA: DUF4142 domain-containing protein [Tepidisphaeraceae bacterium]|nr:DUF4142 domain-containing protein [Tepidisphaeraceae bacterium]
MLVRMIATFAAAVSVSVLVGCQSMERLGGRKSEKLSGVGNTFFRQAAIGDMTELETSRIALENAQSSDVKSFAQRMIDDHTGNRARVAELARSKNVQPPAQLDTAHQKIVDKLRNTPAGPDFDRAYMKAQVTAHQETVATYETASQKAEDPDVKAYATQALPMLRQHLEMARSINNRVK